MHALGYTLQSLRFLPENVSLDPCVRSFLPMVFSWELSRPSAQQFAATVLSSVCALPKSIYALHVYQALLLQY